MNIYSIFNRGSGSARSTRLLEICLGAHAEAVARGVVEGGLDFGE